MMETNYITPRLSRGSAFILGPMLIGAITLIAAYLQNLNANTLVSESLAHSQFAYLMWLTGMVYAVAAGVCWLATIVNARYLRWLVRAGIVVALALLQEQLGTENWLRSLSNLGGLVFFQCMLFYWLGVPNWKAGNGQLTMNEEPRKGQFSIGDVVIATTCIAFLLAIGIRYRAPIDPLGYWLVLGLFWLIGPLIAACTALSFLNRPRLSVGLLAIAILLAVAGIAGLTAAEWLLGLLPGSDSPVVGVGINASLYGRIILSYFLTFALFCVAARTEPMAAAVTHTELDI